MLVPSARIARIALQLERLFACQGRLLIVIVVQRRLHLAYMLVATLNEVPAIGATCRMLFLRGN